MNITHLQEIIKNDSFASEFQSIEQYRKSIMEILEKEKSDNSGFNHSLMDFLDMAGRGCISGNIREWPQLKPACNWAHGEINRLHRIINLAHDELLKGASDKEILEILVPAA